MSRMIFVNLPVTDLTRSRAFLEALGFAPVHAIDRWIEVYQLGSAEARLEWYPRMDVLFEVEGDEAGIERLITATGLPRASFTSEALDAFADHGCMIVPPFWLPEKTTRVPSADHASPCSPQSSLVTAVTRLFRSTIFTQPRSSHRH